MDPEDPDDPDHSQNRITSSFYHFGHILKILSKSVHKLLSYLVHSQTGGQTNPGENITSLAEVNISYTCTVNMIHFYWTCKLWSLMQCMKHYCMLISNHCVSVLYRFKLLQYTFHCRLVQISVFCPLTHTIHSEFFEPHFTPFNSKYEIYHVKCGNAPVRKPVFILEGKLSHIFCDYVRSMTSVNKNIGIGFDDFILNKHSDACIYLPPYK